jgi:hypothetical protein
MLPPERLKPDVVLCQRDCPLTASSWALDEMCLEDLPCSGGACHQYIRRTHALGSSVFLLNTLDGKPTRKKCLPLPRLHPDVAGQGPCTTTLDEVEVTAPTSLIRATRSGIPLVRQA